jgi:hypothetical protein
MSKVLIAATLALLLTHSPALASYDNDRIVTAVDNFAKTFSCDAKAGEPSWSYKTNDKTIFRTAVAKKLRRGSFTDIKVGEIVTVRYHLDCNDRIVQRVLSSFKMRAVLY